MEMIRAADEYDLRDRHVVELGIDPEGKVGITADADTFLLDVETMADTCDSLRQVAQMSALRQLARQR